VKFINISHLFTPIIYYFHISYTIHTYHILFTPIIYYSHLSYTIHTYHILFTPIIYYSNLSYTIHTYHILFTPIIYYSHLSYTIHTYHILFTPILKSIYFEINICIIYSKNKIISTSECINIGSYYHTSKFILSGYFILINKFQCMMNDITLKFILSE